jgi:hypothetical protein
LAAARDETLWNRAMSFVKEKGIDIPFSLMGNFLLKLSKDSISKIFE